MRVPDVIANVLDTISPKILGSHKVEIEEAGGKVDRLRYWVAAEARLVAQDERIKRSNVNREMKSGSNTTPDFGVKLYKWKGGHEKWRRTKVFDS